MVIRKAIVVLCTHNPVPSKLQRALSAIAKNKGNFRLVVIDNASTNTDKWLFMLPDSHEYRVEAQLGNSFARFHALNLVKKDELLIFVDDDNYIDQDFVSNAIEIANAFPTWGVFGGIQKKLDSLDVPKIFRHLLPYVGIRSLGPNALSAPAELNWTRLEPIGAGMCIRPEVVKIARTNILNSSAGLNYFSLGRKGKKLLSGEDSYIARQAFFGNFDWGYSPKLNLLHDINSDRLSMRYFIRLFYGYGRTDLILSSVLNIKKDFVLPVGTIGALESYMGSFLLKKNGPFFPFFHFGLYSELRRQIKSSK
jgi:glycosyltransferase involved in cell wall biosynthesis